MRGKRRQAAIISSGDRLSRSRPEDVGAIAPDWILEKIRDLQESPSQEIKDAIAALTRTQRRDERLLPLYEQLVMSPVLVGDDIQGLARSLFCRMGLREAHTPLIVESQPQRCYHLRANEHDTKTLCGVTIGPGWRRRTYRGYYAHYLNRSKKPHSCQRCYGKGKFPTATEGLLFPVLDEDQAFAIRTEARHSLVSPAKALMEGWAQEWSEEKKIDREKREEQRAALGGTILSRLYRLAAGELLSYSDEELLLLFDCTLISADEVIKALRNRYPVLPRPSFERMVEIIADTEDDLRRHLNPYFGTERHWSARSVCDQVFGRLILSYWPEVTPLVKEQWAGRRWRPTWAKEIVGEWEATA